MLKKYLFNACTILIFSIICAGHSDCYAQNNNLISTNIKLYAGPGENYKFIGTLSDSEIKKYILIDNNWVEIEYSRGRAYIEINNLKNMDISNIPHVVKEIKAHPSLVNEIYFFHIPYKTTCKVNVYSSPTSNKKLIDSIEKGTTITILRPNANNGNLIYNTFSYIEYNTKHGSIRGYAKKSELDDLNNPLKNFQQIKENNGEFIYKKKSYFSCASTKLTFDQWTIIYSENLIDKKFDILQAITAAISGNTDISIDNKTYLFNPTLDQYCEINTQRGNLAKASSLAIDLIGTINNFIAGGNKNLVIHVDLEKYNDEGRIRILTGTPIEKGFSGQTISLSQLIARNDQTKLLGENIKEANEFCRAIYQDIKGEKNCDLYMTFSKEYSKYPYGYNVVFDNNGNCFLRPIIHQGTKFIIYQNKKPIRDLTPLISMLYIPVKNDDAFRIINVLAKNKIYFKNYKNKDLVQIVLNGTINELQQAFDINTDIDYTSKKIAAHVALLYSKNDFLEEFLKRGIFPNSSNFLTLNHIKEINEPTTEKIAKKIEELETEWAEGDVEGDCASLDSNSIIFDVSANQLELILKYNKEMCSGELMCGATTLQMISSDNKLKRAYYRACR